MSRTSTPTTERVGPAVPDRPRRRPLLRLVGWLGWLLLGLGVLVVLYLIYSLWFTNLGTQRAQADLRGDFDEQIERRRAAPALDPRPLSASRATPTPDATPTPQASEGVAASEPPDDPVVAEVPQDGDGSALALLWFERPGRPEPVTDEPYVVVDGVSLADLAAGPGHYPDSDDPGEGNFAVAGHRTTHGAPFFRLDDLQEGDEIHVLDLDGTEHVYRYVSQRIVAPTELWVVGADPLGLDAPTITLTTCHPRFSNRQRLVAFGELVT